MADRYIFPPNRHACINNCQAAGECFDVDGHHSHPALVHCIAWNHARIASSTFTASVRRSPKNSREPIAHGRFALIFAPHLVRAPPTAPPRWDRPTATRAAIQFRKIRIFPIGLRRLTAFGVSVYSGSVRLAPIIQVNSNSLHSHTADSPVIWLTGLSGAGKSTIACRLHALLEASGRKAIALDGDALRAGICADLDFSVADRNENIRRIAHIAKLFMDEGYVTIVATISALASQRACARSIIGTRFLEVFVATPIEECVRRDPKGLYALAKRGAICDFTGVSATYERPIDPDLILDTSNITVESAASEILSLLNATPDRILAHG